MQFIPMLTYNDLTVKNAIDVLLEIADTGITSIGFKNVGLEFNKQKELVKLAKSKGLTTYMEVVSTSKEEAVRSFQLAVKLGVDNVMGGTFPEEMVKMVRNESKKIGTYPFIGKVYGHPNLLAGKIEVFLEQLSLLEQMGVDGLDLLAFRYQEGDPYELLYKITSSTRLPVIVAGSIDSLEKISKIHKLGAWGFTVGTAMFDKAFANGSIADQVYCILNHLKQL
jgi:2,4-dienoyl-CoA reductase-like NADH-dependent reductase (Old Yellow Enzyme family)